MASVKENLTTNYANFDGRSSRAEYWFLGLFNFCVLLVIFLIAVGLSFATEPSNFSEYTWILPVLYLIAITIPSLAMSVRRVHDFNVSGWLVLLNFVPYIGSISAIVFGCIEGTPGPNRFGPSPSGNTQNYPYNPYGSQQYPYSGGAPLGSGGQPYPVWPPQGPGGQPYPGAQPYPGGSPQSPGGQPYPGAQPYPGGSPQGPGGQPYPGAQPYPGGSPQGPGGQPYPGAQPYPGGSPQGPSGQPDPGAQPGSINLNKPK